MTAYLCIRPEPLERDQKYNYIVNTWNVRFAHRILEKLHQFVEYLDGDEMTIGKDDVVESRRYYFYDVPYCTIMEMQAIMRNVDTFARLETQSFIGNLGNCEFDPGIGWLKSYKMSLAMTKPSKYIIGKECDWCFTAASSNRKMKRCKGCWTAAYCCKKHQKLQWKRSHRYVCHRIGKLFAHFKAQQKFKELAVQYVNSSNSKETYKMFAVPFSTLST